MVVLRRAAIPIRSRVVGSAGRGAQRNRELFFQLGQRITDSSPRLRGCPLTHNSEQDIFAWSEESASTARSGAGHILEHVSSTNTARDLELLRRGVGDPALTYHGISYGTQLGAIYANLFPGSRACDGVGRLGGLATAMSTGTARKVPRSRWDARQGVATALAATFQQFLRDCSAAGPRCAFSPGDPKAKWAVLGGAVSRGTCHHGRRPQVDLPRDHLRHTGSPDGRIRNWLNCSNSYTTQVPRAPELLQRRDQQRTAPSGNGRRAVSEPTAQTPTPQSNAVTALCQPIPPCTAEQHETADRGRAGFRPDRRLQHEIPVRVLAGPRRRPLHRTLEPAHVRADSGVEHQQ